MKIKYLFYGLASVVGLAVTIIFSLYLVLVFYPHALLNSTSLQWVVNYTLADAERGESFTWQELNLQTTSLTRCQKKLSFQGKALVIQQPTLKSRIQQLKANFTINICSYRRFLHVVGPINVNGLQIRYDDRGEADTSESFDMSTLTDVLDYLDTLEIASLLIDLQSLEIWQSQKLSKQFRGQLSLTGLNQKTSDREVNDDVLQIQLAQAQGFFMRQGDLHLRIGNYRRLTDPQAVFSFQLQSSLDQGGQFNFSGSLSELYKASRKLSSVVAFAAPQGSANAHLGMEIKKNSLDGEFTLQVAQLHQAIKGATLTPCQINAGWQPGSLDDLKVKINCTGNANRGVFGKEEWLAMLLPAQVDFSLQSEINIVGLGEERQLKNTNRLTLKTLSTGSIQSSGEMRVESVVPWTNLSAAQTTVNLDFLASMPDFQSVVRKLQATAYAVPAPFNQLHGSNICRVKGEYKTQGHTGIIPIYCAVDLTAKQQAINFTANGKLSLSKDVHQSRANLDLTVNIDKLDFPLPDIKLGQPVPAILPDERLQYATEEKPAAWQFDYQIRVTTRRAKAIRIYSNLTDQPIPITLNFTLNSQKPVHGNVQVEEFRATIFRRKAVLEFLTIEASDRPENQQLNGRVRLDTNDYKVFIQIDGTTAKPVWHFYSQPPLPEQDILALILFGRHPETLADDEQHSVGEARSALAAGAISLASMYYLASTPIESVAYNPETNIFSARIKLRSGLSLNIGTDYDSKRQLGLQRRLGGNWTIETTAINDATTETTRGVAMLKWGVRY